jgi:hypothetical protein
MAAKISMDVGFLSQFCDDLFSSGWTTALYWMLRPVIFLHPHFNEEIGYYNLIDVVNKGDISVGYYF